MLNRIYIFILGKISNAPIKGTFGNYRRLSGSSFSVSVAEVWESQAKLRVSGNLRAHKVPFGTSRLVPVVKTELVSSEMEQDRLAEWFWKNVDVSAILPDTLDDKEEVILTFIAGYCVFKVCLKLACGECRKLLQIDRELECEIEENCELSLIMKLDRGKLSFPSSFTRTVVRYCYFVDSLLTHGENLDLFLNGTDEHQDAVRCLSRKYLMEQCSDMMAIAALNVLILLPCCQKIFWPFGPTPCLTGLNARKKMIWLTPNATGAFLRDCRSGWWIFFNLNRSLFFLENHTKLIRYEFLS